MFGLSAGEWGVTGALSVVVIGMFLFFGFYFWITMFFNMMSGKDEDFPGRYDKLIWAGVFIFGSVIGAVVWFFYVPPSQERSEEEDSAAVVPDASE